MSNKVQGDQSSDGEREIKELIERSMLGQAAHLHDRMRRLKQEDTGKDNLTFLQRPYARAQSREAVRLAPVWFTAYMPSIIGPEQDGNMMRPLETLCSLELWNRFAELGIAAVHTGPVMKAGGLTFDQKPYDSIDGWFDPIALDVDSELGADRDYSRLVWIAENIPDVRTGKKLGAVIIGDIVPGHTGMGPDFYLALKGADLYPGLYVLARIDQVLGRSDRRSRAIPERILASLNEEILGTEASTPSGELTRLLTDEEIDALVKAKVIPGRPQRGMGAQAGFGWSITREIEGLPDESGNTRRRWIYLHFFHPKQPTLNFLDPGFAAWRMITGQLNYVMWDLRSSGVRLDANAFLGIEPYRRQFRPTTEIASEIIPEVDPQTWSEAHPLSQAVTNMLAWQARRLGGFSFQEMNMSVPDIAASGEFGPDLAYDFITRPSSQHALLTGDTSLLYFMYSEMERFGVDPGSLVHALQNHDEFTYELVHLRYLESFADKGGGSLFTKSADALRAEMRRIALNRLAESDGQLKERKSSSFYNKESPNGLCTTIPGLLASALGCCTLDEAGARSSEIMRGHLLLAAFNALQPGVFALSGWDLVGALPLEEDRIPAILMDAGTVPKADMEKDYRWVNRGAYRLLSSFGATESHENKLYGYFELPEAKALYGPLDRQSLDPSSFFSHLKRILSLRQMLGIPTAEFRGVVGNLPSGVFGCRMKFEAREAPLGAILLCSFSLTAPSSIKVEDLWEDSLEMASVTYCFQEISQESMTIAEPQDLGNHDGNTASAIELGPWQWKLLLYSRMT